MTYICSEICVESWASRLQVQRKALVQRPQKWLNMTEAEQETVVGDVEAVNIAP